ncbi:uncharacterized protein METZ01_LOCUS456537 [marine metagenome]|uniref:Uncharacterized protein n=1 Tax=marine metagenome TaxID=408172 RepID=A0A383A7U9_9ZZZZ
MINGYNKNGSSTYEITVISSSKEESKKFFVHETGLQD